MGGADESDTPFERARRDNERGIVLDGMGMHDEARRLYERSRGYGEPPEVPTEIPTYNLGRSYVLSERYAEAHETFEEALLLAPELAEAYYDDGLALYCWGAAERDPRNCDLARTRDLWQAASERLGAALARAEPGSRLADLALTNAAAVARELAALERLIAEPPERCQSESLQGGGGGGEGGGGGGEAEGGGGGGPSPLSPQERETIAQALARIAEQRGEAGKFHRRTLPEQFPRAAWETRDPVIWW